MMIELVRYCSTCIYLKYNITDITYLGHIPSKILSWLLLERNLLLDNNMFLLQAYL